MKVRSILGAARRKALCSLHVRSISLNGRGPIVSFSFDDFPRTAYTAGGAILERYGVRGTYYTAMGLMNSCNELGDQFRAADLDSLLEGGHELASHTFTHFSSRTVSCKDFCDDVEKGRKAIEKATGVNPTNFAYPFGDVTLANKRTLNARGVSPAAASARGIIPGVNGPAVDLNLLRANSLYGDADRSPDAARLIRENSDRKTWLIFYTHDVRPHPSPYGCTPELLDAVVHCAVQSDSKILTVQEALMDLGVQKANSKVQVRNCVPV
jgi:peptidoglycan/xylan/chitin deacetylase (PgdA/CDA1 family)